MTTWQLFQGKGKRAKGVETKLKNLKFPPWRSFGKKEDIPTEDEQRWTGLRKLASSNDKAQKRGQDFRIPERSLNIKNAVNAAIYLRRPLLITGRPGSGKTSLAYAIAYELNLGEVLTWPITGRTTLKDGLYSYDAIARLQDVSIKQERDIGAYITLGPLGTAFVPSALPRVLLIDEIDKSDINLPNDLLNLLEEGRFPITELVRIAKPPTKATESAEKGQEFVVKTQDSGIDATIKDGEVHCVAFPIIIMTSNGERDFPQAFKRRCLRVRMPDPNEDELREIIKAHLTDEYYQQHKNKIDGLIKGYVPKTGETLDLATDQLLNTVYLLTQEVKPEDGEEEEIKKLLLRELSLSDEEI